MTTRKEALFILSHGRADRVITYDTLLKQSYKGDVYVIADNEDKQLKRYEKRFGDKLIVFDKKEFAKQVDAADTSGKRNCIIFARNYNFVAARELGVTHFLQLDDDYTRFEWCLNHRKEYVCAQNKIKNLQRLFSACWDFLDETPFKTIALAQTGDFIGGAENKLVRYASTGQIYRKAMNSFFFRTDRPVNFVGRVNEDVNTYVGGGRVGHLFATIPQARISQAQTQANSGGMTEMYLDEGTYLKSFYTVIISPSSVKVSTMGAVNRRLHHQIYWNNTCPVIVDPKYQKPR